jgi:hypothetical protein
VVGSDNAAPVGGASCSISHRAEGHRGAATVPGVPGVPGYSETFVAAGVGSKAAVTRHSRHTDFGGRLRKRGACRGASCSISHRAEGKGRGDRARCAGLLPDFAAPVAAHEKL